MWPSRLEEAVRIETVAMDHTKRLFEYLELHNVDPVILTYAVLLVSAVAVIYCGAHATLHRPDNALPADPADPDFDPADLAPSSSREKLMAEDAYLMPVMGGVMLVGMYFLIKKLDRKYIELCFNIYFAVFGVFAVGTTFASSAKFLAKRAGITLVRWKLTVVENPSWEDEVGEKACKDKAVETAVNEDKRAELMKQIVKKPSLRQLSSPRFVINQYRISSQLSKLPPKPEEVGKWYVSSADLLGVVVGLAVVVANWYSPSWVLGNVLGSSFAFSSIQILTIDSFKTGYIMLTGLFLYDIFFVFGTDIMVTVATSLTVPIKLTAPRPVTAASPSGSNAMLGLGDIIVPAIFLSLCLRFDLWNFHRKSPSLPYSSARKFPKPFFHTGIALYSIALVLTIVIMHTFKAAQPALLYLCPGIGGASVLTALARKEWAVVWGYREETEEDKQERLKDAKNPAEIEDKSAPVDGAIEATEE